MNKTIPILLSFVLGISIGVISSKDNSENCRAIIKANIDSYLYDDLPAEDALDSIDRNCGEFGYSW